MKYVVSFVFASVGLTLLAINNANNVAEISRTSFSLDIAAVIVGLSVLAALLSLCSVTIWGMSRFVGIATAVFIVAASGLSIKLTVDRFGGVSETGKHAARSVNGRIERADAAIESLQRRIGKQRPIAANQCRGYKRDRSDPQKWPKCLTAQGLIEQYEAGLETAQAERSKLGEKVTVARHSEKFMAWIFGPMAQSHTDMLTPVIRAALLEWGTILALNIAGMFAAGSRRRANVIDSEVVSVDNPVIRAVQVHGAVSNRELAKALSWSESRTSRSVKQLAHEGQLTVGREGRSRVISLA